MTYRDVAEMGLQDCGMVEAGYYSTREVPTRANGPANSKGPANHNVVAQQATQPAPTKHSGHR